MSNSYRRLEAAPTPAPVPAQAAPAAPVDDRFELISAAIQNLFEAKGGLDIEQQIRLARLNVENAIICREAEARRLAENPDALREKGERPFVTVSEDRLHSRELTRQLERRDLLRLECRTVVHEAINRRKPRTRDELVATLAVAMRDIDGVGAMIVGDAQAEAGSIELRALCEAVTEFLHTQPKELLPLKEAQQLSKAVEAHDANAIAAVFRGLSQQAKDAFDATLRRAYERVA